MANYKSLALCFAFFLISHHCWARTEKGEQQQQQNQCQIDRLTAREPQFIAKAEAGYTEYWDWNEQSLQCAGVAVDRFVIEPRGLLLPEYINAPVLIYVVQGRGMTGVLIPGCPETFQSSQEFSQEREKGEESQSFHDQHQQIRHFQEGDIIALPAGVAFWCHNYGQEDVVLVAMVHTKSWQNQLDTNPRAFFLAGIPREKHHKEAVGNVFRGFSTQFLAEVFGVDQETARRMQGHEDQRGHIVRVEGEIQVIRPPQSMQQEQQQRGSQWPTANGLEETICSARLVQNINNPSRADLFNPRAGRLTTMDRYNLPILQYLQLSIQRGVLYKNAIKSPNWKQNSHSILYVTRGEGQMQIVDQRGEAVFNERIRQGQLVVIPQNFAAAVQASNQGFEWIALRTNDRATEQTLAGHTSAIRAMPVDVLANAYQISREQARRLKFNREETVLFEPTQSSQRAFA